MSNFFKLFLTLLLALSCATKNDRVFIDLAKSKNIETQFEIKKEKLKKFEVLSPSRKIKKEASKKKNIVKQEDKKVKKHRPAVVLKKNKRKKKKAKKVAAYPKEFLAYDQKAKKSWDLFSPTLYKNEEFLFEVSYLGFTAGYIKMLTSPIVKIGGRKSYHLKAHLRSARYYSSIYKLDDTLESFIDYETFLPLKYSLVQRESSQDVDDLQLFDHDESKTYFWYKKVKKGKVKKQEKEKMIPKYFQDSYSALYFARGLPLKKGDVYEFPIITRAKIWILKMKVESFDEVKFKGKWIPAIKLSAETRFPGVLKKKGDIVFWYSKDSLRRLLKFEAKIKIGSVTGELIEYKEGQDF